MPDTSNRTLLSILNLHAQLHQPMLDTFTVMQVQHLNYYYVDWQHQVITFTGTEAAWLAYVSDNQLLQSIHSRLKPYVHPWASSAWSTAYEAYRRDQGIDTPWLKTDLCVEGQHGYHILEVSHKQPLNLYQIEPLFDSIATFKDESMRLQNQAPNLRVSLAQPVAAPTLPNLSISGLLDIEEIEEAEPMPLSPVEEQALDLRLTWHQDDEIAQQLGLRVAEVQQLFRDIADKYHHPHIPPSLYRSRLPQVIRAFEQRDHAHVNL